MRVWILLIGLSVCAPVFGQSARKLNKQLRAEYLVEKHKYDSLYVIFLSDKNYLEKLRDRVYEKLMGPLSVQENAAKRSGHRFWNMCETLEDLGCAVKTLLPDSIARIPRYATSRELSEYKKRALNEYVRLEIENREVWDINQYKIKEQNTRLAELVSSYRDKFEFNQLHMRDQKEFITELEEFEPLVDRLVQLYAGLEIRTQYANRILTDELRSLGIDPGSLGSGMIESPAEIPGDSYIPRDQLRIIHEYVDETASFPGGMEALKKYLSDHIVYPVSVKEGGVSGKVFLRFCVSNSGKITDVTVMRGVMDCPECDKEATRVIQGMPDWIPGKNNSRPVNTYYNLPIVFKR